MRGECDKTSDMCSYYPVSYTHLDVYKRQVVSSDLPEVLGISDRIIVMHDMHITGTVSREEATQEVLLEMAVR